MSLRNHHEIDIKAQDDRVRFPSLVKLVEAKGIEVKVIVVTLLPTIFYIPGPTRFGARRLHDVDEITENYQFSK